MRVPVVAYALTISAMVVLAVGTQREHPTPALLTGAVLFFLSDLTVARDRFVHPGCPNRLIGLPLDFGG
jgi:uncharacterized membrane protein YhhN